MADHAPASSVLGVRCLCILSADQRLTSVLFGRYHRVNNCKKFRKELSETLGLVRALGAVMTTVPSAIDERVLGTTAHTCNHPEIRLVGIESVNVELLASIGVCMRT